jgi:hypothetical protein
MRPGELILVSVDDHVVEPVHLCDRHPSVEWRDRAPKMVKIGARKLIEDGARKLTSE